MNNKEAIRFIDRLYHDLYLSDEVLHHSTHNKTDKFNNLKEYFDMLQEMHERVAPFEHRKEIIKRLYHARYVINPNDIKENYYELQKEKALDSGQGYIIIDENKKKELQDEVISNQKDSLNRWIDYFLSEETKDYPFWVKYWAFQGMLKLGSYNRTKMLFNKRTKYTTAPFTELNKDALNNSMDLIISIINKNDINDIDLKKMVNDGSFQKIYTYFFSKEKENLYRNEGIWVKYDKGGDYQKLADSLNGYATNWCTNGKGTAVAQLSYGDFYIYYTLDKNNEYKVPRIAIRMEENNIGEIRGIDYGQNVEPEMKEALEKKLKEFPDRDKYYKKVKHMEKLTKIYKKFKSHIELTVEELRFLYEIDEYIIGFGHHHDPRISEIISKRNIYEDLSRIFNYDVKTREDNYIRSFRQGIIIKPNDQSFPKILTKNHPFIDNIRDMELPDIVMGDIYFGGIDSIKNTKLPKRVTCGIHLGGNIIIGEKTHTIIENVEFPVENIGDLKVAAKILKNVSFPRIVHENVSLKMDTYSDVKLPDEVEGTFELDIKYAKNLNLPKIMRKATTIKSLGPTIGSLKFPDACWSITLTDIKNGEGLVLPKMLQNDLILAKITHAGNMILPETVGGKLDLSELIDGTNLVLPNIIGESLDMRSLEFMNGMVLPKRINGDLHISICALNYFGKETLENIVGGKIYIYDDSKVIINKEKSRK